MNAKTLAELVRFAPEKMQKVPIFDSRYMFYDLYCLMPGQSQKVHVHQDADKIYLALEGEVMVTVGGLEKGLTRGQAVMAKAGEPHGVRNASSNRAVLLVVMSPKPN